MNIDSYGEVYYTQTQLCELLYQNPKLDITDVAVIDVDQYHASIKKLHADLPRAKKYQPQDIDIKEFDLHRQNIWYMPEQYQNLDIKNELLTLCVDQIQRDRVIQELELFEQNNLLNLVRYLKYLVDVMTKNNIVWGVGRGSSTASYVLYLIGLHMIDPIKYNIPLNEFFKEGNKNE